jgi:hypothetical protein
MENLISTIDIEQEEYQKKGEENEESVYANKSNVPRKQIDMSQLDNLEEISFASIKLLISKK